MTIEQWVVDSALKQELEEHYKTSYSLSLCDHKPMDIARALTFDGLANSITIQELNEFLETLNRVFAGRLIRGVGLEIGSGPGTFVATLANMDGVERVYGVEACEAIVQSLMRKVVDCIAGENTEKVIGAVGDFNNLNLPDNSIDFVFDFFSLHHSANPEVTLRELSRVLRPGGVILCIDKARANSMSETDLEKLLDIEYSEKWKTSMGLPSDKVHTRRMNGEYEYRLKDWERFFAIAGFGPIKHYNVARIGGLPFVRVVKRVLARFPVALQSKVSGFFSRKITNNLQPTNRIFTKILPSYPREFSLMISRKRLVD